MQQTMQQTEQQWLFLAGFAVYLLAMIALGWWVSRRQPGDAQQSGEDFLLGGRALPFWLMLGTTVATMVGTGSSMGAVGYAYQHGWGGVLYGLGGGIGILLLAWWFAPLRRFNFLTMAEELSYYTGADKQVRHVVGVLIFIACIGWLGAHILGGSMYLAWLTGLSLTESKLLIAAGFAIYVVIGGYTAVVWTDAIQALILFSGFVLMAGFALVAVGGFDAIQAGASALSARQSAEQASSWLPGLSLAVAVAVGVLATPSFRQRIYSGKDVSAIRKSFVWSGVLYLFFSLIPAVLGLAALQLAPTLDNPSYAFPFLALNTLPLALGVLVLLAGISATLSSASSDAIAGVSVLVGDLYKVVFGRLPQPEQVVLLSRLGLVAVVALALGFALLADNIIGYITTMVGMVLSGLFAVAVLGLRWTRLNKTGALAALLTAPLVSLAVLWWPGAQAFWGNPVIPATVLSLLAAIVGSLLTKPVAISRSEALALLATGRVTDQAATAVTTRTGEAPLPTTTQAEAR
ncbi:sodium:solute symporter family protein [Rheinheimera tilapiae]|uniref:Sodium:solute symporter family protein n=1 Tax=Rheinheimera tilapiae TaxID=875043 RepID=A0ABV6BG64_9GAMM